MHKSFFSVDHKVFSDIVGDHWEPVGLFQCPDDETAIERAAWSLYHVDGIKCALLRVTPLGDCSQPIKSK
jgi:hypothetical protein